MLRYTILLPFWIYYKTEDKYGDRIRLKYYNHIIRSKEKYKNKVLKEMLNYMVKHDIPNTLERSSDYCIYLDKSNDDASADFHIADFIVGSSYFRSRKVRNKISKRYSNACGSSRENLEYDWFMDKTEQHFSTFKDMEVERGFHNAAWGSRKYEYILLTLKRRYK